MHVKSWTWLTAFTIFQSTPITWLTIKQQAQLYCVSCLCNREFCRTQCSKKSSTETHWFSSAILNWMERDRENLTVLCNWEFCRTQCSKKSSTETHSFSSETLNRTERDRKKLTILRCREWQGNTLVLELVETSLCFTSNHCYGCYCCTTLL
jgi:hypothetical protein